MDQQIHQHLFLSFEQKSEQLFLTCNINNLIYFPPPHLSWFYGPHLFFVSVRKCEIERSITQFFAPSILELLYSSASILHSALAVFMKMLLTAEWC